MPLEVRAELKLPTEKKKILVLSDHPLYPSGVGTQARFLIEGLLATGKYSFSCLGGAEKHDNYSVISVNPDWVILPVDGFGTREQVRNILLTYRPDALFIFTDPRQFTWLWEAEDEVHQVCPIVYWHVWDNDPYPTFNKVWYESTDSIVCLSHLTYQLVKEHFPEKTSYIPHAFPQQVFGKIPQEQVDVLLKKNFGDKADWFKVLWVNRNAHRKMPNDVLDSFKLFLENLEKSEGHRKALLFMHTNPFDREGPNLFAVAEQLGIQNNVVFSGERLDYNQMNVLHNMTDCCLNISRNEGFGLSTLITLQCGKPIVALKTGGLTSQVIDYKTGEEMGAAIHPVTRKLIGSQLVPFIYEDYATQTDVAAGLMKIYKMTSLEKEEFYKKAIEFVKRDFSFDKMITNFDKIFSDTIENWKSSAKNMNKWSLVPLNKFLTKEEIEKAMHKPIFKKIHPSAFNKIGARV